MLALVALVESAVHLGRDRLADPIAAQFDFVGRAARAEAPGQDVLCFGDSVVKFGVDPRALRERAGLRAFNLATVGNPPPVALALLRRSLAGGARPRAVVVDFKPLLLGGFRPDLATLARVGGLEDGLGLARVAGDPALFGEFAAAWALPTARDRRAIRSAIRRALLDLADPDRATTDACRRNWEVNRGAQLLPPNPASPATAEFPNEPANLRPGWSCDPVNLAVIDDFFREAAGHGAAAYWLLTPIHPRLQAARERLGIDEPWARFVRDRAGAAGAVVVDARRIGLDPDLFVDATHLDRRGAATLSAALADFLQADLGREAPAGPARWVVLPGRPREPDAGHSEDTAESALALRDRAGRRRR